MIAKMKHMESKNQKLKMSSNQTSNLATEAFHIGWLLDSMTMRSVRTSLITLIMHIVYFDNVDSLSLLFYFPYNFCDKIKCVCLLNLNLEVESLLSKYYTVLRHNNYF